VGDEPIKLIVIRLDVKPLFVSGGFDLNGLNDLNGLDHLNTQHRLVASHEILASEMRKPIFQGGYRCLH
jgi:hypothetical protein